MYKCCCDQHTGAEVTREEEEVMRYREAWEAPDYDGKRASWSNGKHCSLSRRKGNEIPPVLRTKMRMSAATCSEVLYEPLFFPDPHTGLATPFCLRASSACKNVVGISDQATENSDAVDIGLDGNNSYSTICQAGSASP